MKLLKQLFQCGKKEDGTTSIEYALILALIIMVAIGGVGAFGGAAGGIFKKIDGDIDKEFSGQ